MKKNNLLKTVLLLVFTILFLWSCRQESLYTDTKNNNNQKVHNKISLNTFKQETKVSKIEEFTVLKNSKSNGKDAGTTSTFIIDSTSIYKLAVNNNFTTYSFRAYNIFESPNVLYNLVYHIKDGKTGYRIFKMEKDSAIPVYDSEIGAITIKKSSSKSISKTAGCTESIKIYIWDCKNGHDWEHCDHCKDCYDVSYYDVTYDCSGGLSGGSGTSTGTPPSNNAPQCGESNAGYSGVMLDPSGYYFDPNEPLSIDAEKLRASYAYNFWNQLDQNHQLWVYNGNIDTYRFILENYLNNYSTTNNTNNLNFANWGIDFFTQNPTTSLEQFQNWFVEGQLDYTNAEEVMFASNLSKVMNDINTYQANDTLSQLNTNWPNWNKITETMKTLVKTSAPLAVKFGKVLFKTLSPLNQNDYSRNFINGHIDAMRYSIDALGVINYNTNTMQWKDIVLCWLFELGNFPINNSTGLGTMPTLGFSGTDYVISGNPNNNMRHLSNHKLVNGIPDKNSIMFLRNIVIERIKQNNLSTVNGEWVFGTDATVDTIIKQDMMQFCLGSYNTDVYIRALGNSQYELTFIVKNKTGWQSGTRGLNDYNNDPTNDSSLGDKPRGVGIHLGGTIGETFGWKETITVR